MIFLKKEGLFIFEFGKGQELLIASQLEKSAYKIKDWVYDYSGIKKICSIAEIKNCYHEWFVLFSLFTKKTTS